MPKYNFMISKAVDLVARKLAGMDTETIARLSQILSEEAQMISEELQQSGEHVSSDILAARLEGLVARMKYEARNQGPDPSPNEFPIFNVSHNPAAPYPNPINHLYDKRYKEAYSTFIKQNQPTPSTPQKNEPSTPTSLSSPQSTINSNSSAYSTHPQGQFQQQSNKQAPPPSPQSTINSNSSAYSTHPQGQFQQQSNKQAPPPPFRQQPAGGWQYVNPYATLPRSHAAYYQQQASRAMIPVQQQPSTNNTQPVRRSSTGEDMRSESLSHSATSNELNYSTNPGTEKIRVRVINDNSASSSTNPQINTFPNNGSYAQRSTLKSNTDTNNNKETVTTRTIYASPDTEISRETMEDLLKVVNRQQSDPTGSTSPITERVIIIDRRGPSTPDNNSNSSGTDRVRTFEIRTSTAGVTPSTPSAPSTTSTTTTATPTPTSTNSTSSTAYAMRQPNYYTVPQFYYQQPKTYTSLPSSLYVTTPYVPGVNNFYPYGYYRY